VDERRFLAVPAIKKLLNEVKSGKHGEGDYYLATCTDRHRLHPRRLRRENIDHHLLQVDRSITVRRTRGTCPRKWSTSTHWRPGSGQIQHMVVSSGTSLSLMLHIRGPEDLVTGRSCARLAGRPGLRA